MKNKLSAYARLLRLHKPLPILLLLWPTLWALWVASAGQPSNKLLFIFMVGVLLMRSAGCVINDVADRHVDGHVERTKNRPLATGEISVRAALSLFLCLTLLAFVLVSFTNTMTMLLTIPALLLAIIYPFCKRFFVLPQIVLGMAWYMGIFMAFTAQTQHLPIIAFVIYGTAVIWAVVYDTLYAMVDMKDDVHLGLHSSAILFGKYNRIIIALLQLLTLLGLMTVGWLEHLSAGFYYLTAVSSLFFVYQQKLIRNQDRAACLQAFNNNVYFGALIFLAFVVAYY